MIYAQKIKMKRGHASYWTLTEIDSIYLTGVDRPGFYSKKAVYDHVMKNPRSIAVGINPYPYIVCARSINGEEYVKSTPNRYGFDNLLSLPRE